MGLGALGGCRVGGLCGRRLMPEQPLEVVGGGNQLPFCCYGSESTPSERSDPSVVFGLGVDRLHHPGSSPIQLPTGFGGQHPVDPIGLRSLSRAKRPGARSMRIAGRDDHDRFIRPGLSDLVVVPVTAIGKRALDPPLVTNQFEVPRVRPRASAAAGCCR